VARICPALGYSTGGPGVIETTSGNTYQVRGTLTYLFNALGHHILKIGTDISVTTYKRLSSVTGGTVLNDFPSGAFWRGGSYGYLSGPDTPVVLNQVENFSRSVQAGGFLQDSWNIADVVTANLGVRYDMQSLYAGKNGENVLNLPQQWSPRVG